jgi:hypothetical protein
VEPDGRLHLVPPPAPRLARPIALLTALLQERGVVQTEVGVAGGHPRPDDGHWT